MFGSQARVGVAVYFLIKTGEDISKIQYAQVDDYMRRADKLKWLANNTVSTLGLEEIKPNANTIWLNQTDNDFDDLIPVLHRTQKESIFTELTFGVNTAKDQWVYDFDRSNLEEKMKLYVSVYNDELARYKTERPDKNDLASWVGKRIKWSHAIIRHLRLMHDITYSAGNIKTALYRPFVTKHLYYDNAVIDATGKFSNVFKNSQKNHMIGFSNPKTNVPFNHIGTNLIIGFDCISGTQAIPIWRYDGGEKFSNVTKYGLDLFREYYEDKTINGDGIFYYTYAVFNDPKYERKYRFNLQRGFPRIPLAKDFWKWADIGKRLFVLHSDFDTVNEYNLKRVDRHVRKNEIWLKLKTEETRNETHVKIIIDDTTTLEGVPSEVLEYRIGSRNPLEWILEFYKESKNQIKEDSSSDKAVRDRFNTYKFADYKEKLITLLRRVTTVCVETVKLRKELEQMEWGPQPKLVFTGRSDKAKARRGSREPTEPPTEQAAIQATLDGASQERLF